jgi:hypothetical protein
VHKRKPTLMRWIEEAEERRLREWAGLESDVCRARVIPLLPIAEAVASRPAATRVLRMHLLPDHQTERLG